MKKGFTLVELLVYMAIIGVIVLVAGQAFVDATKFNVRTRNMITAAEQSNDISGLLKEDLAQMGTKSWKEDVSGIATFHIDSNVFMSVGPSVSVVDSSSYELIREAEEERSGDSLRFRKMAYNESGAFIGVQEVTWSLRNYNVSDSTGTLIRSCKTISGTGTGDCPKDDVVEVTIAEDVSKFFITPSIPGPAEVGTSSSSTVLGEDGIIFPEPGSSSSSSGIRFRLLPRSGNLADVASGKSYRFVGSVSPTDGGETITVSNMETNFSESETPVSVHKVTSLYVAEIAETPAGSIGSEDWKTKCYEFTFKPGDVYSFEFRLSYMTNNMRLFQPGKDLFALGLRKKHDGSRIATAKVNDFMIYPPTSMNATQYRYGKFSVAGTAPVKACLAFTIALYSPLTDQGSISIKKFHVKKELAETYHFPTGAGFYSYNPDNPEEKKLVKAFMIHMEINRHREKSVLKTEIHVPSNGVKATATE